MSRTTIGGGVPSDAKDSPRSRGEGVDELGAIVVDAEDPDPDDAVVVNLPPVSLDSWIVYTSGDGEEVTVADDNPTYDPSAEVVVVAFRDDLEATRPDYSGDSALDLGDVRIPTYAFPPKRLQRVGHVSRDDAGDCGPADRLTDAQVELRERLADTADVDAAADPDDPEAAVLVVEKLGAEHTIDADGRVEGGPLADRLGDIAAEYLGGDAS